MKMDLTSFLHARGRINLRSLRTAFTYLSGVTNNVSKIIFNEFFSVRFYLFHDQSMHIYFFKIAGWLHYGG